MNACLQALLAATSETTTTGAAKGVSTGQDTPVTNIIRKPKHTTPYLERFTGEDKSLYPVFRGLLEAKLQTDAQAISGDYE